MEAIVRLLTTADVPAVVELARAAGWNQTNADIERLLELEPEGCFGVEEDGRVVATATLLTYGSALAWVGMVLTHGEYQRRGYATRLLERTLRIADEWGISTVKLDATDEGARVYSRFGFRDEQPVERWATNRWCPAAFVAEPARVSLDLDRSAFGSDRARLLSLFGEPKAVSGAHAYTREGSCASYLGPFVAARHSSAEHLIETYFSVAVTRPQPWFWDLLPANTYAVELARNCGFALQRRLMRMVRGKNLRSEEQLIYGIAGFELG